VSAAAASSENPAPFLCRILIDGEEIADLYPYLVETRVISSRKAAAECRLFFDTLRETDGHWLIQDSGRFAPWTPVSIEAVFTGGSEEVMRGYVREVRADYPEKMGEAKCTVIVQDESIIMDRQHVYKLWSCEDEPMSDGTIAGTIADDFGFDADVEDGLTNASLIQEGTSIRFLRDRAEANGFELFVRDGCLNFRPAQLESELQPLIKVYQAADSNCIKFSVSHDGYLPDQVALSRAAISGTDIEEEVISPDMPLLGNSAADSSSSGLDDFVWRIRQPIAPTLEEVKARTQAKVNENAWKITAQGELDGTLYGHVLRTHARVGVAGVGEQYSGSYYVDEVTHIFTPDGYRQGFRLLRNATGDDVSPAAADSLSAVR